MPDRSTPEMPVPRRVQIGWLSEDLADEDDLAAWLDDLKSGHQTVLLDDLEMFDTPEPVVWHSHREGQEGYAGSVMLPVFIEWVPTDVPHSTSNTPKED